MPCAPLVRQVRILGSGSCEGEGKVGCCAAAVIRVAQVPVAWLRDEDDKNNRTTTAGASSST